jgi:hypothetical protein
VCVPAREERVEQFQRVRIGIHLAGAMESAR